MASMSRNNIWAHLSIALVLVLIAAFAGGLRKWHRRPKPVQVNPAESQKDREPTAETEDDENQKLNRKSEVLVRFRSSVPSEVITRITSEFNDRVEDRIESVDGLDVIEDEDGKSVDEVVAQYRALPEVEYAEANIKITLDHDESGSKHVHANDELFSRQWGLFNSGENDGKFGADISAMRAWAVTTGSDQVVVAVLDSGVDYSHPDLAKNIWT